MNQPNYKLLTASLPFDISAEALAACLLHNNEEIKNSQQLLVRTLGHLNRVGGPEVQAVSGAVFNAVGQELIYLDINREGLYDTLPEMLFIQPRHDYEDEVEKARHLAQQTEKARRFLLPFEETLYQARIDLEVTERTTLIALSEYLIKIYGLDMSDTDAENREQILSLALLLPVINQVIGNLHATENLLTALLRQPIKITPAKPAFYVIPEAQQSSLGTGLLGVDLLLGDIFQDGIRTLELSISEVLPNELEAWLPGGRQRRFLEEQVLPYLLPVGEQVDIKVQLSQNASSFWLGNSTDNCECLNILGYTTL